MLMSGKIAFPALQLQGKIARDALPEPVAGLHASELVPIDVAEHGSPQPGQGEHCAGRRQRHAAPPAIRAGSAKQRAQTPGRQQRQRGIERQKIAHARHPAATQQPEEAEHPYDWQQIAQGFRSPLQQPQRGPQRACEGSEPERRPQAPQQDVVQREQPWCARQPLPVWRGVDQATDQAARFANVLQPARVRQPDRRSPGR